MFHPCSDIFFYYAIIILGLFPVVKDYTTNGITLGDCIPLLCDKSNCLKVFLCLKMKNAVVNDKTQQNMPFDEILSEIKQRF